MYQHNNLNRAEHAALDRANWNRGARSREAA